MPPAFDPYYKWLGIPPQEQPPSYYRLLALRSFEEDPDVIESAADQRMAHLRTFQRGQYSALSQKLLNEVAAAKVCLLNAEKRALYDQEMKAREGVQAARRPRGLPGDSPVDAPPVAPPGGGAYDLSMLGVGVDGAAGTAADARRDVPADRPKRSEASRPPDFPPPKAAMEEPAANHHPLLVAVGGTCLVLVLLISGVLIYQKGGRDSSASGAADSSATPASLKPTASPVPQRDELLAALKLFEAAHPPGTPESPLAKGPLGRGLILHMSFEPATIEQRDGRLFVRDLSGAGHHGGSASAQLWAQGKVGAALQCQLPLRLTSALIDRQPHFTLVAWVNHPSTVDEGWWYEESGANPIFGVSTGKDIMVRSCMAKSHKTSLMRVPDATAAAETWNFFALRGSRTAEGRGHLDIQVNDATSQIEDDSCVPASNGEADRQASLCNAAGLRIDELMVFDRKLSDAELSILRTRTDPSDGGPLPPPIVEQSKPIRPVLLEPLAGDTLANGAKAAALPAEWTFRWTAVPKAQEYEVSIDSPSSDKFKIDSNVAGTSLRVLAHGVAAAENCRGWHWKVRAKVDDRWGDWSDERPFELERPSDEGRAPVAPERVAGPAENSAAAKPEVAAATRRALPDLASQRKAQELLHDAYAKAIAAARSREMILTIADDMLRRANESQNDPAAMYILLDRARLLAAEAGGANLALEIADQMDKSFEIKLLPLKTETLSICLKKTNLGPEQATEAAAAALDLMQDLAKAGNAESALAVGQLARDHIRKPSDPMVMRRIPVAMRWLHELQVESAKVSGDRQKLSVDPNDAAANLAVGRFECFVRRDWQAGLQLLAKGSDAALREMARLELAVPRALADREKLANLWYDRAEKESLSATKQAMFFRARYWYEGILGEVTGLERAKVDKRITRIGQLLGE